MKFKEWAMFCALGLIWGSSFVWIKVALGNHGEPFLGYQFPANALPFTPFLLVTFRLLFGMLGLVVVLFIQRPVFPREPRVYLGYAFMGLFYATLPFCLITWGETLIPSGVAAILNGTVPLFTIVIAHIWLQDDKINLPRLIGLLVGFIGVVILVSRDLVGDLLQNSIIGQLAVIAAAICYALSSTFSRKYLRGQPPVIQSFVTMLVADLVTAAATIYFEQPIMLPTLPIFWLAAIWLGLLGSCLAYIMFFSLVNAWGPTRATLVTYIFPVVGLALGVLLLAEPVDWRLLVGTVLVVGGIGIVNLRMTARRGQIGSSNP